MSTTRIAPYPRPEPSRSFQPAPGFATIEPDRGSGRNHDGPVSGARASSMNPAAGMSAAVTAANAASPSCGVSAATSSAVRPALFPRLTADTEPGPATPPFNRTENLRKATSHDVEPPGSAGLLSAPPPVRLTYEKETGEEASTMITPSSNVSSGAATSDSHAATAASMSGIVSARKGIRDETRELPCMGFISVSSPYRELAPFGVSWLLADGGRRSPSRGDRTGSER